MCPDLRSPLWHLPPEGSLTGLAFLVVLSLGTGVATVAGVYGLILDRLVSAELRARALYAAAWAGEQAWDFAFSDARLLRRVLVLVRYALCARSSRA